MTFGKKAVAGLFSICAFGAATFAALPASAASIIASTASGTQPSAFSPITVNASDYIGINPNTTFGPQDIIIDTAGYAADAGVKVVLFINFGSGSQFSPTSVNFSSPSGLSFAGENLDGSIGTFGSDPFASIGILATQMQITSISVPFEFLRITDLIYRNLGSLATPGATVTLSGNIVDQTNSQHIFETIDPTVVVLSARNVPAPGALLLLVSGLLALPGMRRRAA